MCEQKTTLIRMCNYIIQIFENLDLQKLVTPQTDYLALTDILTVGSFAWDS